MNTPTHSLSLRTPAAALAAALLALAGAPQAHAAGHGDGTASAAVLRADLDVSLLHQSVRLPVHTALNEVRAPATAGKTALTVTLDGVESGRPVQLLGAGAASAKATADRHGARATARLAHARVHVPGLPLLSLIEVEAVTSTAVCEAGEKPEAKSTLAGPVRILGKRYEVTAGGPPTEVTVPGVGEVSLGFSQTRAGDAAATATALALDVTVDPLKLGVARVEGRVTLAEAACEAPAPAAAPAEAPAGEPAPRAQGGGRDLAETGGGSSTPLLAGTALALLAAGAGVLLLARRRARR
ncbi:hypothetical protein SRB5_24260 [Streptomyces sp. RB5]|uniref:Gram-positive cocci surface proteins LPxTG domain-containing protein n=1 Tax=Streptomyces smaragdinus TaxID=2585196 RepID=A0A7K0CFY2_9ACTN|nr:SCO1860 family LAETG-anchored protein [Streptomyces smaragdinus]MQY12293.1 hypothetical protein [Streptomyces smaragdinus]